MVCLMEPLTDLLNLLRKYSIGVERKFGIERDDFFGEGSLLLVQLIQDWDPPSAEYSLKAVFLYKLRHLALYMRRKVTKNVELFEHTKVIRDRVGVSSYVVHDPLEFEELVDCLCKNDLEREYLRLKVFGYKQYEIMDRLRVSRGFCREMDNNLELRFNGIRNAC